LIGVTEGAEDDNLVKARSPTGAARQAYQPNRGILQEVVTEARITGTYNWTLKNQLVFLEAYKEHGGEILQFLKSLLSNRFALDVLRCKALSLERIQEGVAELDKACAANA
jgi:hypothetical protein